MSNKTAILLSVILTCVAYGASATDLTGTTVAVGDSIMPLSAVVARGLPVLCVETVDNEEPTCDYVSAPAGSMGLGICNVTKVPGRLLVYYRVGGVDSLLYDSGDYEDDVSGMTIKIRGNSSAYYDKKPYKIKLQKKQDLLFRGNDKIYKDKDWILLRDELLMTMSAFNVCRMVGMTWTSSSRYVNVVMNGIYRGVYMLCESVKRNPDCRLDVDKNTGYIFECDPYWWNEHVYVMSVTNPSYNFTFKYPDEDDITEEQLAYAQALVSDYEASLTSATYPEKIDVTSFAAWCLVHDIEGTKDGGGANRYYSKYDNSLSSKIVMPLAWDFDAAERRAGTWSASHVEHMTVLFNSPNRAFVNEYVRLWCRIRDRFLEQATSFMTEFGDSDEGIALQASYGLEKIRADLNYRVASYVYWRNKWFEDRYVWLDAAIMAMHVPNDVNVDGVVDISDVTVLIDMLLGSEDTLSIADVDGSGVVDIDDVTWLIDFLFAM